ncbi:MAG: hypothetical protein IPJ76_14505 [Flavobacteriales bacterium]|nr:MAG: hypothetical protein IPJ76_14505 [Flavobacteriales bacterium]
MKTLLICTLLSSSALTTGHAAIVFHDRAACTTELPGGDPRIQLCGKLTGDVTRTDLDTAAEVKLVSCVSGARITTLAVCIRNCEGKTEALTAANGTLTPAMKKMIVNLPKGTPFVVRVSVKDEKGRDWQVPDAAFVWKG